MVALALAGCASSPDPLWWHAPAPATPAELLALSSNDPALSANPELRARLARDAHTYFRYVNVPFSSAVCYAFGSRLDGVPNVNLHGDAHLEQYAVTDAGRGLTDFDDSSWGPPVIDVVRFGVSLRLACRERGWNDLSTAVVDEFLGTYVEALHDEDVASPEPGFVEDLEAGFSDDRSGFLEWADSIAPPLEPARLREVEEAFADYVARLRERIPEADPRFFVLKRCGTSSLGVGSATDEKYVLRVEGPGPAAEDDVVLEAKEVRNLAEVPCVRAGAKGNPFRTLVGRVHTPYRPYLGYFGLHGKTFWVHAWLANYHELSVVDPLLTRDGLRAVAAETGVQLARAHLERWDGSRDRQLGHRVEHSVERMQGQIREAITLLTASTVQAWQRFRTASAESGGGARLGQ